jgi:hypothetical protein
MNNIIKIEPIRASQVEEETLTYILGQIITKTALTAGQTLSDDTLAFILEGLVNDLQKRFTGIEIPEIITACENGVRRVYGDYFGINIVSINQWIQSYINSGEHQKYLNSKPVPENQKQIAASSTKTTEEIDRIMRAGIVQCFADYQKTGFVIDFGSVRYDWLFLHNILVPEDEQIEYYLSESRQTVEAKAKQQSESIYKLDRYEGKKLIDELEGMTDKHAKIQSEAKKLAMMEWFENIIESKQDINELIK